MLSAWQQQSDVWEKVGWQLRWQADTKYSVRIMRTESYVLSTQTKARASMQNNTSLCCNASCHTQHSKHARFVCVTMNTNKTNWMKGVCGGLPPFAATLHLVKPSSRHTMLSSYAAARKMTLLTLTRCMHLSRVQRCQAETPLSPSSSPSDA